MREHPRRAARSARRSTWATDGGSGAPARTRPGWKGGGAAGREPERGGARSAVGGDRAWAPGDAVGSRVPERGSVRTAGCLRLTLGPGVPPPQTPRPPASGTAWVLSYIILFWTSQRGAGPVIMSRMRPRSRGSLVPSITAWAARNPQRRAPSSGALAPHPHAPPPFLPGPPRGEGRKPDRPFLEKRVNWGPRPRGALWTQLRRWEALAWLPTQD